MKDQLSPELPVIRSFLTSTALPTCAEIQRRVSRRHACVEVFLKLLDGREGKSYFRGPFIFSLFHQDELVRDVVDYTDRRKKEAPQV